MNIVAGFAQSSEQSVQLLGAELKSQTNHSGVSNIHLVLFVANDTKKIPSTQKCSAFESVYGYPKQDLDLALIHDTVISVLDPLPCFKEVPSYRKLTYSASPNLGKVPGGYDVVWQSNAFHDYSYENIDVNLNKGISISCHLDAEKNTPNYFSGLRSSFSFYACSGLDMYEDVLADSGGVVSIMVLEPMTATSKDIPANADPAMMAPIEVESEFPTIKPPYKNHPWNPSFSLKEPLGAQSSLFLESGNSGFKLTSKNTGRYLIAFQIKTEDEKKRTSTYQRIQQIIIQ